MQEELERGQTFEAPLVNVLHETAEAARTSSTYVQARLAGEPRVGPPTNKPSGIDHDVSLQAVGGNASSYHTSSTVTGSLGGDHQAHESASLMFKPSQDGGFNASTFGANSGIKPLNNLSYQASQLESLTALPTATSTAEGNPATSSALDPLASLLGESEFSVGNLGVGFQSSVGSAYPSHAAPVHHGGDGGPGVKKSTFGGNNSGNMYNSNNSHHQSTFNNYSIDEDKSYAGNANLGVSKPGGALGTFDSYLSSADNMCVVISLTALPVSDSNKIHFILLRRYAKPGAARPAQGGAAPSSSYAPSNPQPVSSLSAYGTSSGSGNNIGSGLGGGGFGVNPGVISGGSSLLTGANPGGGFGGGLSGGVSALSGSNLKPNYSSYGAPSGGNSLGGVGITSSSAGNAGPLGGYSAGRYGSNAAVSAAVLVEAGEEEATEQAAAATVRRADWLRCRAARPPQRPAAGSGAWRSSAWSAPRAAMSATRPVRRPRVGATAAAAGLPAAGAMVDTSSDPLLFESKTRNRRGAKGETLRILCMKLLVWKYLVR
jgi:hypothetical protein